MPPTTPPGPDSASAKFLERTSDSFEVGLTERLGPADSNTSRTPNREPDLSREPRAPCCSGCGISTRRPSSCQRRPIAILAVMSEDARQLGAFLRARREALAPEAVGLGSTGRR